jgi:hypothetical protein
VAGAHGRTGRCGNGYRNPKRKGKPNLAIARKCLRHRHFFDSVTGGRLRAFTRRSSRYLNCPSKLLVHIRLNKPANGCGKNGVTQLGQGPPSGENAANDNKGRPNMFHGTLDLDGAAPIVETAIQDVLFERGLYWASGRSGVVNLVAAHKWFNLAALKGRSDAIALRREVAEQMNESEIAAALSEARAWMTAH